MKVEKLQEPSPYGTCTVKKMGHITEVRYMQCDAGGIIKKLDKDSYVRYTPRGKSKTSHIPTYRMGNVESISRSLRNLRDIINTNVTDVKKCLWVTLTYAENMTDECRLYNDYRRISI